MDTPELKQRRRGRPRAADAVPVEHILDVALDAFATHGYHGVSLRTISRALGGGHNLIYQRFATKDELWYAAVDFGFGNIIRRLQDMPDPAVSDPLEQLRQAIRRFLEYWADYPQLLALMTIEARQDTDRLRHIYWTYLEPSQKDLTALLKRLADDGVVRRIPHRTFFFLITFGATSPFSLVPLARLFDSLDPCDPPTVAEHADLVATVLVEGLLLT
jgi:AcrR family transcriptional regulator